MRASLVAISLTLAFMVSGCVDPTGSGSEGGKARQLGGQGAEIKPAINANWAENVFLTGDSHSHYDMAQHQGLSTPNFKVIGHNSLKTDYHGAPAGGYFCADTKEKEGRVLSVVHSWVSDVAFVLSDVTDPTNPEKIGEFVMARTQVYDLAISPDQRWVFLATSPSGTAAEGDPSPPLEGTHAPGDILFRDACTGEERIVAGPEQGLPFASGIVLVDIQNPRVPAIVDFRFFPPGGGHSVQVEEINGELLILITQALPPAYYVFVQLMETPAGPKMEVVSVYNPPSDVGPVENAPVGVSLHDAYLQEHPVTGKAYAYLAAGGGSLGILDITDVRLPTLVSRWNNWAEFGNAAPASPFVHEALPLDTLIDGKHYTFIGEECGSRRPNSPTCLVAMLDTTDPAKPVFIGGWTLPVDIQWAGGLMYSLHYLAYTNGTLFATNYHGGLWAIDVSTPEAMRTMPSIGVFMPDNITAEPVAVMHNYEYAPVVLDTNVLANGKLVVYDATTGLYVVEFDPSNPAPSPAPWPFPFNQ